MTVPILARIVKQGIAEGVFETAYVEEVAGILYVVAQAMSEGIAGVLLKPDDYDDPEALAQRKYAATINAIEGILGATPGSLPILDEQVLAAWFED